MEHVLIDTNVYLSFYELTQDDLDELLKLNKLIEQQKIVLYLPDQIRQEYLINRHRILRDTLKSMKSADKPPPFPLIVRNHPRFDDLIAARNEYQKVLSEVTAEVNTQAIDLTLPADEAHFRLISLAERWETTPEILASARDRVMCGQPPGKQGSHGDAIAWESILRYLPDGQDLSVISRDGDYASPLEPGKMHPYLDLEFRSLKLGTVELFSSMSSYFNTFWPHIKLSSEVEAAVAIEKLSQSPNFVTTHAVIAELNIIATFSPHQVEAMCQSAIANPQVRRILRDPDVAEFFTRLMTDYGEQINPALLAVFTDAMLNDF